MASQLMAIYIFRIHLRLRALIMWLIEQSAFWEILQIHMYNTIIIRVRQDQSASFHNITLLILCGTAQTINSFMRLKIHLAQKLLLTLSNFHKFIILILELGYLLIWIYWIL